MKSLQLQEAKQQFSAVAEKASRGQPQVVTKHGKPFVVIVGIEEWKKSRSDQRSVLEILRSRNVDTSDLDLTRSAGLPREVHL